MLSRRHVFFAAQSNVLAKSRGGFRCVTFYTDIAPRHVCMHNVMQFSQRHVIFRNVTYRRNVTHFRRETYRFRHVMLRVSLRHVSFRCCVVSGLCAQRRVIFRNVTYFAALRSRIRWVTF